MNSRIEILDPIIANQIAAGEVVERPASVVKELVENSLDAGASKIDIYIEGAGIDCIRVSDNGCGMIMEDAVMAFKRHATSKIRSADDLNAISSLGFRGEALPSIASVSRVELITRRSCDITGCRITVNGGETGSLEEAGCPAGTSITVRDLFFNTPARRKFLKSNATELGQISDILSRLIMAYPQVAFKFTSGGRTQLVTSGSGNLLEALVQVYGKEAAREMIPVSAQSDGLILKGFLGRPHQSRATRSYQTFFINGRFVRSKAISQAVAEGYHTLIPANRYPLVVLNLSIPVNTVDVNVHPTKLEVRFTKENLVTQFVAEALRQALTGSSLIPGLRAPLKEALPQIKEAESYPEPEGPSEQLAFAEVKNPLSRSLFANIAVKPLLLNEPPPAAENVRVDRMLVAEQLEHAADSEPLVSPNCIAGSLEPDSIQADKSKAKLPELVPLGQVDLTYIVARGPEGLYILDQHAAHERINYERLWRSAMYGETQLLLEPLTMDLTEQEMEILIENIGRFTDLGFLLEFFGGNTFLVRGKPADLNSDDPRMIIRDLLETFCEGPKHIDPRKLRQEFIYLAACKSSIKANEGLTRTEMEQLIGLLGQTENPFSCPHGRPTIIALSLAELAKRFQRV